MTSVLTLGATAIKASGMSYVVTDQRVILAEGMATRRTRSVPVAAIQDVSTRISMGVGWVVVSAAGGALSVERFGPMTSRDAETMADVIMRQAHQARAGYPGHQQQPAAQHPPQQGYRPPAAGGYDRPPYG